MTTGHSSEDITQGTGHPTYKREKQCTTLGYLNIILAKHTT